jgi:hypothetical protein
MTGRALTATAMAFRDQGRRPLVLILLVVVPTYVITRSIATTEGTPRQIGLPGGDVITTTMKDLHGAVMGGTAVAFVAALVGVFIMQSALQGDRRLVVAGFRPGEAISGRLLVLAAATALVVAVSAIVTALYFIPVSWAPFLGGLILIGLIYGALGALAGAILDKLAATYLMLFLVMTDLGIVSNPMFGDGTPEDWAALLPGYGPNRLMVGGAFADSFPAAGLVALSFAWVGVLIAAVLVVLRRAVGQRA